jgi:hypothetical protein
MLIWSLKNYVQVDIEDGLNFYEIADAIQKLTRMSTSFRYLMVVIHTEICRLSHRQLRSIIEDAARSMSTDGHLAKTALVVNTDLQSGIARLFMEGVRDMNCRFDVFRERDMALNWFFGPSG